MKFKDLDKELIQNINSASQFLKRFIVQEKDLLSLEGVPEKIIGNFDCGSNKLKNLEFSPLIVTEDYYCNNNQIKSLKGRPKKINGVFICRNNKLKNLDYSPESVGSFNCSNNKLTTLKGNLKEVRGIFDCRKNKYLINQKEEIIINQIKALSYKTDEGFFDFKDIENDFLNYKEIKIKKEQREQKELKKIIKIKINQIDYGLSL